MQLIRPSLSWEQALTRIFIHLTCKLVNLGNNQISSHKSIWVSQNIPALPTMGLYPKICLFPYPSEWELLYHFINAKYYITLDMSLSLKSSQRLILILEHCCFSDTREQLPGDLKNLNKSFARSFDYTVFTRLNLYTSATKL